MKGNLIAIDLDGPVLDVRDRHWAVHRQCLQRLNVRSMSSKRQFWAVRRRGHRGAELLGLLNPTMVEAYAELFRELIEADRFLALDRPQPLIREVLKALSEESSLALITLRRRRTATRRSLTNLGLWDCFQHHFMISRGDSKTTTLRRLCKSRTRHSSVLLVGDSEVDGKAAMDANVPFVAVTYGIRSRQVLAEYHPARWVNSPSRLFRVLGEALATSYPKSRSRTAARHNP